MTGLRRQPCISAAVLLLVLASPCGSPLATAGPILYTWAPITISGYDQAAPLYQPDYFNTSDGVLTIGYDPDDLGQSYIDVSTGSLGYEATASDLFTVSVSADRVTFTADYLAGGVINACILGDPGPLDSSGRPVSLDSLLGGEVYVSVSPSYHGDELTCTGHGAPWAVSGQAVPEPSALLMLALGLGGVGIVRAARRHG